MNTIILHYVKQPGLYCANWDYVQYNLMAARKRSPNANIFVIGDKDFHVPGVQHININDYRDPRVTEVEKLYKHMCTNPIEFSLNAILRWYYIYKFCKDNGLHDFIHIDTDVMLLKDAAEMNFEGIATNIHYDYFREINIPIDGDMVCPHIYCCSSMSLLDRFLDFVIYSYSNPDSKFYQIGTSVTQPFDVGEMILQGLFCYDNRGVHRSLKGVRDDGSIYETAIEIPEGAIMENRMKKLTKIDNDFYCSIGGRDYKMNLIHWHGGYKRHVKGFYESNLI